MTTNRNSIIRLAGYKTTIHRLKSLGLLKVFSDNLADAAGVSPSQVRKDFSLFGIKGNKRGGYIVDELIQRLNVVLNKNGAQKVIIVGAGHIGTALMKYKGFAKEGIQICACFDNDPAKFSGDDPLPVLAIEGLKEYIRDHKIKIAVIAVPDVEAQQVFDSLISCGIKGVLNFAPVRLRGPEDVAVNNVNLGLELENVIYFVNTANKA